MRITKSKTLREYQKDYPNAKGQLVAWESDAKRSIWLSPEDVKERYASASILNDRRVVFNIKGNEYRLVVEIHYNSKRIYSMVWNSCRV